MQTNSLRPSSKLFHAVVAVLVLSSITLPGIARVSGRTKQDPHPNEENVKVIPDGTEFTVVTTEEINSKTASEGDQLSFKVLEDVAIDGHVVIAKDTLVKGVVATTTVDNQRLKLRSSKGKEGDDKTGTTVALVVLFGPLGFLKHGKNAQIKPGTQITVYTDEEKRVQVKN